MRMDPALYVVALVSFFIGSFGYVAARYLILPVVRYRRLRNRVAAVIARCPPEGSAEARAIRKLAADLSDCFTAYLPHWYKLYLEGRREESPLEASKTLMALSNTRNKEHAARQVEKIRRCLKLSSSP